MAANWSTLLDDILVEITKKMETFEDLISFSMVCMSWNHVTSQIKPMWRCKPWLLLVENPRQNPHHLRKVFNPTNNKCYRFKLPNTCGARCWGSAYGFIVVVDRRFNVQLFNPFTKAQIHFPSLKTFADLPEYDKKDDKREDKYDRRLLSRLLNRISVIKVSGKNGHDEFVIMMRFCADPPCFARSGDPSWTTMKTHKTGIHVLVDVAAIEDNVYALYEDGSIEYWNVKEFQSLELLKPKDYGSPKIRHEGVNWGVNKKYIVKSGSDLLLVLRYKRDVLNAAGTDHDYDIVYRTIRFSVYRLDSKHKIWEEIKDLGDALLFVGHNCSICVSSPASSQRNSIYFTDDENVFWNFPKKFGGHDMGIYDMRNGTIRPFYHGDDTRSSFSTPTWFIPQF